MNLRGASAWVNYLDKVELPVLSKTITSISAITESEELRIEELVRVILQDADLTSKILKLANSSCYNPMRIPTSTMSRAIVQIGFDSIKAIAISSILVDQLSQRGNQRQLFRCMVCSFHAAVQAKYLASDFSQEEQEAIFIAALLYDVGEAAFWSSSSKVTQELDMSLNSEAHLYIDDQKRLLGTSFRSISRGLSQQWGLGEVHEESLGKASSRAARIVCIAVDIAHQHHHGWDKKTLNDVLPSLAALTDKSATQIRKALPKNAEQAARLAEQFGVKGAAQYLKSTKKTKQLQPNQEAQFEALLKISEMHSSGSYSADQLLNAILESMHYSIGLERIALFISDQFRAKKAKQGKSNSPKSPERIDRNDLATMRFQLLKSVGHVGQYWQKSSLVEVPPSHKLFQTLSKGGSCIALAEVMRESKGDQMAPMSPFSGLVPSLIGPMKYAGKTIGWMYADRLNEHEISREQLASFRLFVEQTQRILESKVLLSKRMH